MDALLVQVGALAARGAEKLVADGIEHDAGDRLAIFAEADRDREARISVRKVRGAVERIDVPAIFRAGGGRGRAPALFGDDRVIGKAISDFRDDNRFRALVRFRYDVDFTLVGNLFRAIEVAAQNFARLARGLSGKLEVFVHSAAPGVRYSLR